MAPLWTVHVDEVRPDQAAVFERLNIAENQGIHAILSKYGQPIKPVYEIMTSGAIYMSMRPKDSFTDFDTPSTVPDSVSKPQAAQRMLADWQRCLAGSETVDATPRRDFADLSESVPWLGMPPR